MNTKTPMEELVWAAAYAAKFQHEIGTHPMGKWEDRVLKDAGVQAGQYADLAVHCLPMGTSTDDPKDDSTLGGRD